MEWLKCAVKRSVIVSVVALVSCTGNLQDEDEEIDVGNGCKVTETVNNLDGCIQYSDVEEGTVLIHKPFGYIGQQTVPAISKKSSEHWVRLLESDNDIFADEYLKDQREPSYERTANWLAPIQFPYTYVGMCEYPHEVHIGWDGAIGLDPGFFSGKEGSWYQHPYAIAFSLNGKPVQEHESLSLLRGQLDNYLPAIQYVYQRDSEHAGWEQIVFAGNSNGRPMLFARFRLRNYATEEAVLTFSASPLFEGQFKHDRGLLAIAAPFPQRSANRGETFVTTLIPSEPCEIIDGRLQWRFTLPQGQSKDLYFAMPGHSAADPITITTHTIRSAFYRALLEQKQDWETFFGRGVQLDIPEPAVRDIYKSALAKLMISIDGNEPRGGAVHYEGYWPFCHLYVTETMLYLGYFDEAKRYLNNFTTKRIDPNGQFLMSPNVGSYQTFDSGRFLSLLTQYYHYTQDASLILENQNAIDRVINYIKVERHASMKQYDVDDPRHGLVTGVFNNDHKNKAYYYTTDAPVCLGLKRYSQALEEIATTAQDDKLVAKADALSTYADNYYELLRRSFATAVERDDSGTIAFIHPQPLLPGTPTPFMSPFRANDQGRNKECNPRLRAHYRFHERPRLIGSGFLTDEEVRSLLEYERRYDKTVLGIRRFVDSRLDDFQSHSCEFQKLRLGMVREYLMKYYAYLHYILMSGSVGIEQVGVVPDACGYPGRRIHAQESLMTSHFEGLDGAHATWPVCSMTRWLFVFDDPNEDALWIARGIPTHWLEEGKTLSAKGLTSKFGKIDYQAEYGSKKLTIEVSIEEHRSIPLAHIGIRVPGGGKAVSVMVDTPDEVNIVLDSENSIVTIKDVAQTLRFTVAYE